MPANDEESDLEQARRRGPYFEIRGQELRYEAPPAAKDKDPLDYIWILIVAGIVVVCVMLAHR